jgi:hypothetical protein
MSVLNDVLDIATRTWNYINSLTEQQMWLAGIVGAIIVGALKYILLVAKNANSRRTKRLQWSEQP